MAKHSNFQSWKRSVDRKIDRIKRSKDAGHEFLVQGGVFDHARGTSGRISSEQFEELGHPLARLKGLGNESGMRGHEGRRVRLTARQRRKGNRVRSGSISPFPINRQTGNLRKSFKRETLGKGDDRLMFTEPYAAFVLSPWGIRATMRTSKAGNTYRHGGMVARDFYSPDPRGVGGAGQLRKAWRYRLARVRRQFRQAHQ